MFLFEVHNYNLKKTLECGQVFRYYEYEPNIFHVNSANRACFIAQSGNNVMIYDGSSRDNSRYDYWYNYFNFGFDLVEFKSMMYCHPFLRKVYDYSEGICLLNQNPWECLISFIISHIKFINL